MLNTIIATKMGMTQAWSKTGKRLAVTKCKVGANMVVGQQAAHAVEKTPQGKTLKAVTIFEIGYGKKKIANTPKPLRSRLEKSGFSVGVRTVGGLRQFEGEDFGLKVGDTLTIDKVLSVGDVVAVQGETKGRGFAGAVKRYGFAGGPKTHGQSDRQRAVGSIGNRTTPGRVWKDKRMPGHMGNETQSVSGLVVLYIDLASSEVWLSGPVPGFNSSSVKITKTGEKRDIELDLNLMGLQPKVVASEAVEVEAPVVEEVAVEAATETAPEAITEVVETTEETTKA